jgi:hypothetical protein
VDLSGSSTRTGLVRADTLTRFPACREPGPIRDHVGEATFYNDFPVASDPACHRYLGFAGPAGAKSDHVLAPFDPVTARQFQNLHLVQLRDCLEVEAVEALARGERIHIDAPTLFNEAEGGIVGDVDVLMGAPDQGANDYLAAVMSGPVPAYRGLCSLVLRQVGMGNNPYLKPWAVRVTRVMRSADGAQQWYPETAAIEGEAQITDTALLIALDASGSMSGSRMDDWKKGRR